MYGGDSSSSSVVLTSIGWFFIPTWVTAFVQGVYYHIIYGRQGLRGPSKGSLKFNRDRRIIHGMVITGYLIYSIYDAYISVLKAALPGGEVDFYTQLNVPTDASLNELKRTFRRLSVQFHPDKISGNMSNGDEDADRWVEIKRMYEILSTYTLRFGYDRFGSQFQDYIISEKNAQLSDLIFNGLQQNLLKYYLGSAFVLILLLIFRSNTVGKYWRFYILLCGMVLETVIITRTDIDFLSEHKILPYQAIQFIRRVMITVFIGIEQLGSLISGISEEPTLNPDQLRNELRQLQEISRAVNDKSKAVLHNQLMPFEEQPEMKNGIKQHVEDTFVRNRINNDPEVSDAIKQVMSDA